MSDNERKTVAHFNGQEWKNLPNDKKPEDIQLTLSQLWAGLENASYEIKYEDGFRHIYFTVQGGKKA